MKPIFDIILVSAHAHYPWHYWPGTLALMRALQKRGLQVRTVVFSVRTDLIPAEQRGRVEPVFRRLPFPWNRLVMGKTEQRRPTKLMFNRETVVRSVKALMLNCETAVCLIKALRIARECRNPILHFIGGSFWPIFLAVPRFRHLRFVYMLYGRLLPEKASPSTAKRRPERLQERVVSRALATGRLDLVCETEFLRDNAAPLAGSHIHIIPYAIDDQEELPTQQEARRRLGLPAAEKVLLFFGTHRHEKDYRTALKGCLQLPDPPLALFVGKVISDNDPQLVVAECRYPKARIVDEFVPEDMAELYFAAADAVALPYAANLSGVLIECCRHLRPMIAAASPFFSPFIARYGCGLTYKPGDSASFAETVARLLTNTTAFRAALERAQHEHSWAVITNYYLELYAGNLTRPEGTARHPDSHKSPC
jgi:glycosyltransferase involved in cell wall biosynthesis